MILRTLTKPAVFVAVTLLTISVVAAQTRPPASRSQTAVERTAGRDSDTLRGGVVPERPVDPLDQLVDEAIETSSRRFLTAGVHTPWQIFHGILALRHDFELKQQDGERIPAYEWVTGGATWKGESLFQTTPFGGRAHPYTQPYIFEGHPNQFMAIMSMSELPLDFEFKADLGTATITVADIIRNAQKDINNGEEITWTLWALSRYLEPDATWTDRHGRPWSMEQLVQIQTRESLMRAACGGTHAMFALSSAYRRYLETGRPVRGVWFECEQKIRRHVLEAQSLQNRDGSFSTKYFQGPGWSRDFNERLATSGHMLEWLMIALSDDQLNEPWVRRAVEAISRDMIIHRRESAECGPLYHALDALVIYRERTRPDFDRQHPLRRIMEEVAAEQPALGGEPDPPALPTFKNESLEEDGRRAESRD